MKNTLHCWIPSVESIEDGLCLYNLSLLIYRLFGSHYYFLIGDEKYAPSLDTECWIYRRWIMSVPVLDCTCPLLFQVWSTHMWIDYTCKSNLGMGSIFCESYYYYYLNYLSMNYLFSHYWNFILSSFYYYVGLVCLFSHPSFILIAFEWIFNYVIFYANNNEFILWYRWNNEVDLIIHEINVWIMISYN